MSEREGESERVREAETESERERERSGESEFLSDVGWTLVKSMTMSRTEPPCAMRHDVRRGGWGKRQRGGCASDWLQQL